MPTREDAIQAVMVLKDLADTEVEFLNDLVKNPVSMDIIELVSHANVIKTLLQSQTTLNYLLMSQMVDVDDKLKEILQKLSTTKK